MSLLPAIATAWMLGLAGSAAFGPVGGLALVGLGVAGLVAARALVPQAVRSGQHFALCLAVAALCAGGATQVKQASPVPPSGLCRLVVDVNRVQHGVGSALGIVTVVSGERVHDHVPVLPGTRLVTSPVALPVGARVEVLAQLKPEQPFRNITPHPPLPDPDPTAGRAWLSASAGVRVIAHGWGHATIEAARHAVRTALDRTLPPSSAGIARALVLGESRAVNPEDASDVRAAGLSHVLAVSGLHVTLVVGALVALLHGLLLWTPLSKRYEARRIACALGIVIVFVYAPFAGGSASAWRAAVTAALAWGVVAAGRRPHPPAVTAAAAMLLSAITPAEVWNLGFLLSIVATAAIVSFVSVGERTEGPRSWLQRIQTALQITWRAFLATAPLVLWTFGTLPWIGLLANLLLVPLASVLLLPLVMLHALLATSWPSLGWVTAPLLRWAVDGFVAACAALGRAPGFSPPPLSVVQGLLLFGVCLAWLLMRASRVRWALTGACVFALVLAEVHLRFTEQPRDVLRATYLDVGQGDAALVDMPNGALMLIDAGGNPNGGLDPGRAVVVPLLQARRRARIDVAVITHPHPDHYGGLRAVVEAGIEIKELWDSGQSDAETPNAEYSLLLNTLRTRGTRVRTPSELCERPQHFGTATVRVLWPCPSYDPGHDPNDNSLVLRMDHGRRSFLFTGDIESHAEHSLVSRGADLNVDVFKVPHHGSRTSSSQALLDAVSPALAVVSAGAFNRYGHPHVDVSSRLERAAQRFVRIDQTGATIVVSDGQALRTSTWLNGEDQGAQYMP